MNPNGKILITTAAICLIALIVVSAGWSVATSFGLVRVGSVNFMVGGRPGGAFAGRELENGQGAFQPPEGFQPGDGNFQPPEGFQQGRQNFSSDFSPRTGLVGLLGIARWLGVGLSIAAIFGWPAGYCALVRRRSQYRRDHRGYICRHWPVQTKEMGCQPGDHSGSITGTDRCFKFLPLCHRSEHRYCCA